MIRKVFLKTVISTLLHGSLISLDSESMRAQAIDINAQPGQMIGTSDNPDQFDLNVPTEHSNLDLQISDNFDETEKFLGKVQDNKFRKRLLNESDAEAESVDQTNQVNQTENTNQTASDDVEIVNLKADESDAGKEDSEEKAAEDGEAVDDNETKNASENTPEEKSPEVADIRMNEDTSTEGDLPKDDDTATESSDDEPKSEPVAGEEGEDQKSLNSSGNDTADSTEGDAAEDSSTTSDGNQTTNDDSETTTGNDTAPSEENAINPDEKSDKKDTNANGNFTVPPEPFLLSEPQSDNSHDFAALYLSRTLVDMRNSSFYKNTVQSKNFETFGHSFEPDGKWRFFIVEDRVDDYNDTSIWFKEVLKQGDNITIVFERMLFRDASRAKLFFPDDQLMGSIVIVFETYKECHLKWSHLSIVQFANVQLMKLNIQVDLIEFPRTLNSTNDRKPSIYDMKWQGSIRTSKFTLVYEYETPEGEIRIGKGIHTFDPMKELQWETYPTMMHKYYESKGLELEFGQFQKVKYKDFEYFLTDGYKKNDESGEIERQIVLGKWTLVPLAILPPVLPADLAQLRHFSSPSVRSVNDKIAAISYQAQSDIDSDDYTQVVYFIDLPNFDKPDVGKWSITLVNQRAQTYEPVDQKRPSLVEVVKENLNRLINYVFRW